MKLRSIQRGILARLILAAAFVSVITGCAVGNTYSYRQSDMAIPVSGDEAIGLTVVDRRPYVLSGDKPAAFIGLQRGGFGNPFDVTTASGQPLADEVQTALANAMRQRGYKVAELFPSSSKESDILQAIQSGKMAKNIVLVFREWKTDAMMSLGLSHDLVLQVIGPGGAMLGTASSQSHKESLGPGGFEDQNALLAQRALASKIEALFRDTSIQDAL
jgi:hypothetical protein